MDRESHQRSLTYYAACVDTILNVIYQWAILGWEISADHRTPTRVPNQLSSTPRDPLVLAVGLGESKVGHHAGLPGERAVVFLDLDDHIAAFAPQIQNGRFERVVTVTGHIAPCDPFLAGSREGCGN